MFAPRSTHKRKRSAKRRDAAHSHPIAGRAILSGGDATITSKSHDKGKGRLVDGSHGIQRLEAIAAAHPFNHRICLFASLQEQESLQQFLDKVRLPDPVERGNRSATFARVTLSLFLDPIFLTAYIKRGKLVALSSGKLDVDDVFCVDGRGKLHLHIGRDTYQTLGLVGQQFKTSKSSSGRAGDRQSGRAERYLVSIDLRASSFTPGKPGFDRTLDRLRAWDERRSQSTSSAASWDAVFYWDNQQAQDSVSATVPLELPSQHVKHGSVKLVPTTRHVREAHDVWLPEMSDVFCSRRKETRDRIGKAETQCNDSMWTEAIESLAEWVSLSELSAECVRTYWRPDQVNSFEVPSPRRPGRLAIVEYVGFLSSSLASEVLACAQQTALQGTSSKSAAAPFAFVRSTGFADAPLAWLTEVQGPWEARPQPASLFSGGEGGSIESSAPFDDAAGGGSGTDSVSSHDTESEGTTGPTARRKRNKARQKRGYTNPAQVGHQVASHAPSPASASGWLAALSLAVSERARGSDGEDALHWLAIENVGGTMRS